MLNQSLSMYKLLKILKSKLKMIRARKLLASISLQNDWDVVFLAPHLSPAGLSPVLTMKRKLWNISMGNQSFHEQRLFETSRNTFFQSNSDHFLQENGFDATNTPPVGCEWHYNITLIIMCQSDSQFWPLLSPTAASLKSSSVELQHIYLGMIESGEVSRSLRYCNAKPTLDRTGASSWRSIPLQK